MDHKLNYTPGVGTGIDTIEKVDLNDLHIFSERNKLIIEGLLSGQTLKVTDVYGNIVWNNNINSNTLSIDVNSGLYLIILIDADEQFVYKCLVP